MSRATALDALAYIVHDIRPDWDQAGILAVLQRHPDRTPLPDLAVAAIWAACTRTDQKTPAVIGRTGSHWDQPPTGQKPAIEQRVWQAPTQDTPPADPATITRARARLTQHLKEQP